jgi:type IV pilus assembly protein PilO
MADNPLSKLPLAGQVGVALVISALLGGAFWWFYWSPAVAEQQQKTSQLETLRKEIQALEITANKLPEFQREVAALESRLENLKRVLPPAKETPELMKRMQALASESRLDIKKFTPGATVRKDFSPPPPPAPGQRPGRPAPARPAAGRPGAAGAGAPPPAQDYYEEWPINVDVDGSYHNLGQFFDRVGRLPRLVTLGNLKIKSKRAQTSSSTIEVSCVATTYVYVEAPAQPAGAAPAAPR